MSANSLILWAVAAVCGFSAAMLLSASGAQVATLDASLGPSVTVEPL